MPVDFQWTTQHHIPENITHHKHCCEDLKSYNGKGRVHVMFKVTAFVGMGSMKWFPSLKVMTTVTRNQTDSDEGECTELYSGTSSSEATGSLGKGDDTVWCLHKLAKQNDTQ
jgi:hypothetical protein